ncbi:MAG: hypothetical protein ACI4II_04705 [Acutalibacteraceae bacterium]
MDNKRQENSNLYLYFNAPKFLLREPELDPLYATAFLTTKEKAENLYYDNTTSQD